MTVHRLGEALIREHHEIDAGIEEFTSALGSGAWDPVPLTTTFEALRRHIYLEEELLFPPIRRAGLLMPVMVMLREHGELWELMNVIEERLHADDPEPDGLQAACRQLLSALDQHNMKEEPIVYPHAATDLTPAEAALLEDFIATGRTPSGWVCEAAR